MSINCNAGALMSIPAFGSDRAWAESICSVTLINIGFVAHGVTKGSGAGDCLTAPRLPGPTCTVTPFERSRWCDGRFACVKGRVYIQAETALLFSACRVSDQVRAAQAFGIGMVRSP